MINAILAAGLIIPPGLIDPPDIPINPAFVLDEGLRDYQMLFVLRVAELMRQGVRRILIVSGTGTGKTRTAAALLRSTVRTGLTGEFQVHRHELIKQTSAAFVGQGLPHGFIARGFPFDPDQGVTITGVQTLVKRLDRVEAPHLLIVDECHLSRAATYEKIIETYGPDVYLIGLTATPERLDGKGLGTHFDVIVEGPSVAEMIARKFLCDYQYFAPDVPDLQGINPDSDDAAAVVDRPKIIGNIVDTYVREGLGMQGIVFAKTRDHSRHIAEAFLAAGIPAMHVDGTMDAEREEFDRRFRSGDIRIGCNVGLFSAGYDVPNVGYVGIASPTKSLVNHLQSIGRALRPAPGKPYAVIADHAGNALPTHLGGRGLGLPDDVRAWSLDGAKARQAKTPDHVPITQCMSCYRIYPSSLAACPSCASERKVKPQAIEQRDGKMSKVDREELRRLQAVRRKAEERECKTFREFVTLAKARGYEKPRGWAVSMCRLRRLPIPPLRRE